MYDKTGLADKMSPSKYLAFFSHGKQRPVELGKGRAVQSCFVQQGTITELPVSRLGAVRSD